MDEPKLKPQYCVYKHTSPSGKIYIGITSLKPYRRWDNGNGYRNNAYFMKAIQKYGWDNITHEILYAGLSKEEAEVKEVELIRLYQSDNRQYGYNIKDGGGVHRHSEETKEKMSKSHKGRKSNMDGKHHSEETKQKLSEKQKERFSYTSGTFTGLKHSENSKKKMSESHAGKKFTDEHRRKHRESVKKAIGKKILMLDVNTEETIKCFDSITDASIYLGDISMVSNVSKALKGKYKYSHGYKWKYASEVT